VKKGGQKLQQRTYILCVVLVYVTFLLPFFSVINLLSFVNVIIFVIQYLYVILPRVDKYCITINIYNIPTWRDLERTSLVSTTALIKTVNVRDAQQRLASCPGARE
jgi:hypothetical protein